MTNQRIKAIESHIAADDYFRYAGYRLGFTATG